ncbi:hypothetical protein PPYR_11931 [Photinus pyralis]|uniref:HECT domain-containing protein n=3 Tax=Photinus pyralis TaxID=7054 RepID=A0A5N4ACQ7_PHOPY|nr:uncharacterized protein LOC116177437 [Photinus pyralis]KAB0795092.1 hypothetical protein PPYR_11931 [Photinus pyralis]
MGEENCLEQMNLSLEEFLKTRGLSNDEIENMKLENIDEATIQVMDEEVFKKYIPRLGDRIAVKNFCQKKLLPKKNGLIEKLRQKMAARNARSDNKGASSHVLEPKKHRKTTRAIELGFMAFNDTTKQLTQVRLNKGGGTRKVDVDRTSKNTDILEFAKKLFFPNNISKTFGPIENFTISLLDFCKSPVDTDLTVEEMYNETKVNKLRFYLSVVKCKEGGNDLPLVDDSSENEMVFDLCDDFENDIVSNQPPQPSTVAYREDDINQPSTSNISGYLASFIEEDLDLPLHNSPDNFLNTFSATDNIFEVTQTSTAIVENILSSEKLVLHRGQIFQELIEATKNYDLHFNSLQIEVILPNGRPELAEDVGGVFRDVLSEFWTTFYENCTEGTDYKVPIIRHDFGIKEWEAVAKILVGGYRKEKYFPIRIAPVFFKQCFKEIVNKVELVDNFLNYVSESDKNVLSNALNDFQSVDLDDLYSVCTLFKAKWVPSKENIRSLIEQIAEQEILQRSAFIVQCFTQELFSIARSVNLDELYKSLSPSVKNVISCFEKKVNSSDVENQMFAFLLKYIKESDEKTRCALLRFCTGSNLANQKINVDFIESDGFARVPIAHTCNKLLQLPKSYKSFVEFRSEFNALLISGVWVMDII